jgi:hypothetical protein
MPAFVATSAWAGSLPHLSKPTEHFPRGALFVLCGPLRALETNQRRVTNRNRTLIHSPPVPRPAFNPWSKFDRHR